jgi:hypothetical protein
VTAVTGLQSLVAQAESRGVLSNRANIEQMVSKLPADMAQFLALDPHHTIMTVTLWGDVEEED